MTSRYETDIVFIRELTGLLQGSDLSEIEIKREFGADDALTVRLSRNGPTMLAPPPAAMPPPAAPAPPAAPLMAMPQTAEPSDPAQHPGAVASPIVGTVYLQPEPDSDPFVRVGDSVSEGQTLLIVEAMKTMNQIPAPRSGTVKRIMVEDGTPVEYGSPLMIIE
ncbi:MAG: acetyl-CoA carboxylase biotin carboxyl carrier protein [Pseudomonadota bacterium]